jgi:hypothetical protein
MFLYTKNKLIQAYNNYINAKALERSTVLIEAGDLPKDPSHYTFKETIFDISATEVNRIKDTRFAGMNQSSNLMQVMNELTTIPQDIQAHIESIRIKEGDHSWIAMAVESSMNKPSKLKWYACIDAERFEIEKNCLRSRIQSNVTWFVGMIGVFIGICSFAAWVT